MVPRGRVCLYVTDRDRSARLIERDRLVATLRAKIRSVTGGQTSYLASGDYISPAGIAMDEATCVLEIFCPVVLTNAIRDQLVEIFVDFGLSANQEVVQVSVLGLAYWIPTGLLLDQEAAMHGAIDGGELKTG